MYCKYCGIKVNDAAVFCTNCGKQIRKLRAESGSMTNGRPATASEKDVCEKPEVEDTVESIPTYFCPERGARCSDSHNSRCCTKDDMELRTLNCNDSSKEIRQQEEAKKALVEKSDGDDLSDKVDWPVIEPSQRRGVLEGEFKGALLGCGNDGLYLFECDGCTGLTLSKDTVAGFNPIGNLPENSDVSRDVVIRWKHGETSLMLMDEETFSILEACCERNDDLDRDDVKEGISGLMVKGLYITAALSIIPLTIWMCGIADSIVLLAAFLAFFPWVICIAAAIVLGNIVEWYFQFQLDKRYFTPEERRERECQRYAFKQRNEAAKREKEASERAKKQADKKREEQERQAEIAKNLKCPICGSHDVERISGRAILASTALKQTGKQYKCKYCKHMW